jgi:hypothetical protein
VTTRKLDSAALKRQTARSRAATDGTITATLFAGRVPDVQRRARGMDFPTTPD